jgi:hypothetical protein
MRRGERSVRQESVGNRGRTEEMEGGGSKSGRCQVAGAKREWKGKKERKKERKKGSNWTTKGGRGGSYSPKRPGAKTGALPDGTREPKPEAHFPVTTLHIKYRRKTP